jgi:hypothetical protein
MQAKDLHNPGLDHQATRREVALSLSKLQVAASNAGRVPSGVADFVDFLTEARAVAGAIGAVTESEE